MSNPFIPLKTADLKWQGDIAFSALYNDTHFAATSGMEQSRHIFIEGNNLIQRWQELPAHLPSQFNIGEIGFGAALNFLFTWSLWEQYAPSSAYLHFISSEQHPLKINDLQKILKLWPNIRKQVAQLIDYYPMLTPGYHHLSFSNGRVNLTLMLGEALENFEQLLICGESMLESRLRTSFIDAWYLDGLSSKKNESICPDSLLKTISMLSKPGTTLTACSTLSVIKTGIQKVGFKIEEQEFGQNRHRLSAIFKQCSSFKIKTPHTPWYMSPAAKPQKKSAIIVGAGLAGAFTAYSLARRGWQVTIVEELETPGSSGSANSQAVLFPKFSAYKSPLSQLMLLAFIYSSQFYKTLLDQLKLGELNGILLLAYNEKEKKAQESLKEWLLHYPELGEIADEQRASTLAGLPLDKSGLFIPQSGWLNSPLLCKFLIERQGVTLLTEHKVASLFYDKNQWIIHNIAAPVLILANGATVNSFKETEHLPIKISHGQMTKIYSTRHSSKLLIPLCAEGHVLPEINGTHLVGATYDESASSTVLNNERNITTLNKITNTKMWSNQILGHWSGLRASTPDYLPLVGQAPKKDEFISLFAKLETDSKRWIANAGSYYPGLYICTGFGSRGLTTIPLCAEWLASFINDEFSYLPRNLVQALSPARFLRRDIIRGLKNIF